MFIKELVWNIIYYNYFEAYIFSEMKAQCIFYVAYFL